MYEEELVNFWNIFMVLVSTLRALKARALNAIFREISCRSDGNFILRMYNDLKVGA